MHARTTMGLLAAFGAAALLAAGCGSDDSTSTSNDSKSKTSTTQADSAGPESTTSDVSQEFDIAVKDGVVDGGVQAMKVSQGDHVKITITSNVADEAHLHGIDKEVELEPGKPATIEFDADEQGAYELELHHAGTTIGTVEVR